MIETNGFKKGVCLTYRGQPMIIVDVSFSTPTARGSNTIAKTKMRNLVTGQILNEAIRSGEKFAEVDLERNSSSYLYNDGSRWYFMDDVTFEQFDLSKDDLGGIQFYLVDGIEGVEAMLIDGNVVSIQLPLAVEMKVTKCDPTIKGATAQAQLKPATTETGLELQVPPYLEVGEKIRIDTRDGRFLERAK